MDTACRDDNANKAGLREEAVISGFEAVNILRGAHSPKYLVNQRHVIACYSFSAPPSATLRMRDCHIAFASGKRNCAARGWMFCLTGLLVAVIGGALPRIAGKAVKHRVSGYVLGSRSMAHGHVGRLLILRP